MFWANPQKYQTLVPAKNSHLKVYNIMTMHGYACPIGIYDKINNTSCILLRWIRRRECLTPVYLPVKARFGVQSTPVCFTSLRYCMSDHDDLCIYSKAVIDTLFSSLCILDII